MNPPPKMSMPCLLMGSVSLAVTFSVLALPAQAQSLVELYESARAFDASYQSAKLQYEANLARADQARAGILPTAGLSAGASRVSVESTFPSASGAGSFSTQNATLSASQPLYRPGNWATYEQGFK